MKQNREGREKEAHSLSVLGIFWICLGIVNPIFFIVGIIFLSKSASMRKRLEREKIDITNVKRTYYNELVKKNNTETKSFCSECGTQIEPEDFFCFTCGRRVN
ncbi:MAG: hypothetical protein ACFFAJ_11690 [Candidatus Hodarchaeota archaeon]